MLTETRGSIASGLSSQNETFLIKNRAFGFLLFGIQLLDSCQSARFYFGVVPRNVGL